MKKIILLSILSSLTYYLTASETNAIPTVSEKALANTQLKTIESLEETFITNLSSLIKTDITETIKKQINENNHPLMAFGKKLFEQDIISLITKQALELLKALKKELIEAKKNETNKSKRSEINKKIREIKKACKFLDLANEYLEKETKEIERLLNQAMNKVNTNLNAAEKIIQEFSDPQTKALFTQLLS